MKLPKGLTIDIIMDAAKRQMTGTDNTGFCMACGEEHFECEPDARNYVCESCGEAKVFGAEGLLMMVS